MQKQANAGQQIQFVMNNALAMAAGARDRTSVCRVTITNWTIIASAVAMKLCLKLAICRLKKQAPVDYANVVIRNANLAAPASRQRTVYSAKTLKMDLIVCLSVQVTSSTMVLAYVSSVTQAVFTVAQGLQIILDPEVAIRVQKL